MIRDANEKDMALRCLELAMQRSGAYSMGDHINFAERMLAFVNGRAVTAPAVDPMDGWKPIESAPRDGTMLVLAEYSHRQGRWLVWDGAWLVSTTTHNGVVTHQSEQWTCHYGSTYSARRHEPSLWRLPPALPAPADADAQSKAQADA